MSTFGKALIAGVMILAPSIGPVAVTEAQPPIRIGASASKTGTYATLGQQILLRRHFHFARIDSRPESVLEPAPAR